MNVRDMFFTRLYENTKAGEDIVIVSSDIGAPSLDDYRRDFPHRFVNVGIAEQNAIAVAGGIQLSNQSKRVVTFGLNPFPVTRAFDQLRNILASLKIPITVTALNAGTCSADAGYTHMVVENMSMVRTLKNIQIVNPTDEAIINKLVDEILKRPFPRYVQFDKFINGRIYAEEEIDFDKGFVVKGRGDTAVVTYGIMARKINEMNIGVKVLDCFSLPIDMESFVSELSSCSRVVVVEDSIVTGGIGSMVLEIFNDKGVSIPVIRKGLRFADGYPCTYTNRDLLLQSEGLSDDDIECFLKELCEGKYE